jgi:hypothetical protein
MRVPVPLVPRPGQERRDEIRSRRSILPSDLREYLAFAMDSEWWYCPAYEPGPRRRSGLLGDAEYDYAAVPYPQQQVLPPPEEDEAKEVPLLVEDWSTSPRICQRRRPSDGP